MRNGRALTCIVLGLLVALPSAGYLAADSSNEVTGQSVISEKTAYNVSTPFRINSNAEFAAMAISKGWPGDGSQANPYIIDNYDINGSGKGFCIYIGNTTCNFTVQNCYLHHASGNSVVYFSNAGVNLFYTQNGNLINNTAVYNSLTGIYILGAKYSIIDNNILLNNQVGIFILGSQWNQIANNTISNNDYGIRLNGAPCWNTIHYNTISNNNYYGIIFGFEPLGFENVIYHNNFIINIVAGERWGYNIWNRSYPICGNYWSNYGGTDANSGPLQDQPGSDGIGDTPYEIGDMSYDYYPLMSPFDYTEYNIPLLLGWNLISLPTRQLNESIDSVLENIAGKWDYIQAYNSSNPNSPWESYATFKPASLNNLNSMNHLRSFWIHVIEPGLTLTVKGDKFGSPLSIPLYAGWNLVGYPTLNTTTSVANALWGTGADRVEVCDPTDPYRTKEVGPSYLMKPGEGYWVHVPTDTVWVVNW